MMYLNKFAVNPVILELTSVSSLINPHYLFEMVNDINPSHITYFTGQDISTYLCRYNRFDITVTGATDAVPLSGIVSLVSGSYTYNVYESTGATLSVSATTGRIISGGNKAIVNGIDSDLPEVYR